jgi:hypothetical protein
MQEEIFNYLDTVIKPSNENFVECTKEATDDEQYQFVCGGISGLIQFKFKGLSPKQVGEFHIAYVKARSIMWASKGKLGFLGKLFGGLK